MPERCSRVLLLSFPLVILAHQLRFDSNSMNHDAFYTRKTACGPEYTMVLAGDSRVLDGISPAAMHTVLSNQKILNFGYASSCLNRLYLTAAAGKLDTTRTPQT